jgi:preprotein translocase subunit SecG
MAYNWVKPTKLKIIVFVIISLVLFYSPIITTLTTAVVLEPVPVWNLRSPAYSIQSSDIVGVSNQYFGAFSGADAALISVAITLLFAYLISCILFYVFKKQPKTILEKERERDEHSS